MGEKEKTGILERISFVLENAAGIMLLKEKYYKRAVLESNLVEAASITISVAALGAFTSLLARIIYFRYAVRLLPFRIPLGLGYRPFYALKLQVPIKTAYVLVAWLILTLVLYVASKIMQGKAKIRDLTVLTGYSMSPLILGIIGFTPLLAWLTTFFGWIWSLVCMAKSVKHANNFNLTKTIATVLITMVLVVLIVASLRALRLLL